MIKYRFFYLKQKGRIIGPIAAGNLLQMFKGGTLSGEDEISPDKENWCNAGTFFSQNKVKSPAPASSKTAVNILSAARPLNAEPPPAVYSGKVSPPPENVNAPHTERRAPAPGTFAGIFLTMFLLITLGCTVLYFFRSSKKTDVEFFGHSMTANSSSASHIVMSDEENSADQDTASNSKYSDSSENENSAGKNTVNVKIREEEKEEEKEKEEEEEEEEEEESDGEDDEGDTGE